MSEPNELLAFQHVIMSLAVDLIESHGIGGADEYATAHHGDADHYGAAPEACTFCKDIEQAVRLLEAYGIDVSNMRPEECSRAFSEEQIERMTNEGYDKLASGWIG